MSGYVVPVGWFDPRSCGCGRPHLLDLFCGAGGAAFGYTLAGFHVVGVDFVQRRDFPATVVFVKADCLDVLACPEYLGLFDLVHASPPCKVATRLGNLRDAQGGTAIHPDLIPVTRDSLDRAGVPYVIENVEGAAVRPDVLLCGSMFPELHVYDETGRRWLKRHRLFELGGWGMCGIGLQPDCRHSTAGVRPLGVYATKGDSIPAGGQTCSTVDQGRTLMGMGWASWSGLTQAIPPAYTAYLGRCFLEEQAVA